MRMKGLIVLVAAAAAAVVLAVVVSTGGGAATDPRIGTAVLPDLSQHLGDVGRLGLVHGETRLTLLRKGDGKDWRWVVEEKSGYPADAGKARQALLGLAEIRYVEPKTRKPEFYPRLEVEDAGKKDSKSTLVTVADDKGSLLAELITGKRRVDELGGGNDGIYVRKPGDAQSWLARGTLDLSGDVASWLDRKIVDLPDAQVKEAVLTQPDGSKITIQRDKPGDTFTLADLPAGKKLKSDTALVEPAGALASLELTDVRPAADFDFPKDGVTHAEYTTFDGLTVAIEIVDKDGATWAHLQAKSSSTAEKSAIALNAKLAPWIYAIASYKASALRTKLADLIVASKSS